MTITARYRLERALPSAIGIRALTAPQHPGTNGWVSEWGTNAHGEIAGCPPSGGLTRTARRCVLSDP
ncbi:hypothetical protein AB0P19_06230 [Microbacterium oleivorans]|uniref:hypothetical protein n=1 Tax=Microbacterium TaxID=33882 RepID=UPI0033D87307